MSDARSAWPRTRDAQREIWRGEGSRDGNLPGVSFDASQLARRPIAGKLTGLHPHGSITEMAVDRSDNFSRGVETFLRTVGVQAGPVAEHDRGLTALNQVEHAAGGGVLGDVL